MHVEQGVDRHWHAGVNIGECIAIVHVYGMHACRRIAFCERNVDVVGECMHACMHMPCQRFFRPVRERGFCMACACE